MDNLVIVLGLAAFSYGVAGLLFLAFAPDLAASRIFGPRFLTGRLEASHRNKAMMLLVYLFSGACFALTKAGYLVPGVMAFVGFIAVATASARALGAARAAAAASLPDGQKSP